MSADQPSLYTHTTDRLNQIIDTLTRYRWLWIVPTVICTLLALGYAILGPKSWSAKQSLVVRDDLVGQSFKPGRFDSVESMKSAQETILAISRKPQVIRGALTELGPPSTTLLSGGWPSEKVIEETQGAITLAAPNGAEFGKTEVIVLSVKASSRDRARRFIESLLVQIDDKVREIRSLRFKSMETEMGQALQIAQQSFRESARKLQRMEEQIGPDLTTLRGLIDSQIGNVTLQSSLAQIKAEIRANEAKVDIAEKQQELLIEALDNPQSSLATSDELLKMQPVIKQMMDELIKAQTRLAQNIGKFSEEHPMVASERLTIRDLNSQIRAELTRAMNGLDSQIRVLTDRIDRLGNQVKDHESRLSQLSTMRVPYQKLVEEYSERREVLRKAQSDLAEIQSLGAAAKQVDLMTRVDEPQVSTRPIGLSKKATVAAGLFGGLIIGFGLVMFFSAPVEIASRNMSLSAGRNDLTQSNELQDTDAVDRAADAINPPPQSTDPIPDYDQDGSALSATAAEIVISETSTPPEEPTSERKPMELQATQGSTSEPHETQRDQPPRAFGLSGDTVKSYWETKQTEAMIGPPPDESPDKSNPTTPVPDLTDSERSEEPSSNQNLESAPETESVPTDKTPDVTDKTRDVTKTTPIKPGKKPAEPVVKPGNKTQSLAQVLTSLQQPAKSDSPASLDSPASSKADDDCSDEQATDIEIQPAANSIEPQPLNPEPSASKPVSSPEKPESEQKQPENQSEQPEKLAPRRRDTAQTVEVSLEEIKDQPTPPSSNVSVDVASPGSAPLFESRSTANKTVSFDRPPTGNTILLGPPEEEMASSPKDERPAESTISIQPAKGPIEPAGATESITPGEARRKADTDKISKELHQAKQKLAQLKRAQMELAQEKAKRSFSATDNPPGFETVDKGEQSSINTREPASTIEISSEESQSNSDKASASDTTTEAIIVNQDPDSAPESPIGRQPTQTIEVAADLLPSTDPSAESPSGSAQSSISEDSIPAATTRQPAQTTEVSGDMLPAQPANTGDSNDKTEESGGANDTTSSARQPAQTIEVPDDLLPPKPPAD